LKGGLQRWEAAILHSGVITYSFGDVAGDVGCIITTHYVNIALVKMKY